MRESGQKTSLASRERTARAIITNKLEIEKDGPKASDSFFLRSR